MPARLVSNWILGSILLKWRDQYSSGSSGRTEGVPRVKNYKSSAILTLRKMSTVFLLWFRWQVHHLPQWFGNYNSARLLHNDDAGRRILWGAPAYAPSDACRIKSSGGEQGERQRRKGENLYTYDSRRTWLENNNLPLIVILLWPIQIKVMLRMTTTTTTENTAKGGENEFIDIDQKKRQITFLEPPSVADSLGDRAPMVSAPKIFAFDGLFTANDSQVNSICIHSYLWPLIFLIY